MDKGPQFLQQKVATKRGDMEEESRDSKRVETYQPITRYVLSLGADSN